MPLTARQKVQKILGVTPDDEWGALSQAAFEAKVLSPTDDLSSLNAIGWHHVMASSFADPADVRAFKRCKATGKSDSECFKVGDNGIGKWGDDTTADRPMCALPPDDWKALGKAARGAGVFVNAHGRTIKCELRDTMPAKKNIKNGAGIDLNPAACAALGLRPPVMAPASWKWA